MDILLESRPFVDGLPTAILFQLLGVKILATSLSRASGLVGGVYAPSLFIGAATGMAYGKFMRSTLCGPNPLFHLLILEVASPQAYGLVTFLCEISVYFHFIFDNMLKECASVIWLFHMRKLISRFSSLSF